MVYKEPVGEGSVASTMFVGCSNIVGAGVLVLPTAIHAASIIPGTTALVLMALLAVLSIFYMILCCQKTGRYTYLGLLSIAVSPRVAKIYEVVLFAYTYLILVGWSRIIIDSMPPVARNFFGLSESNAFASGWFWMLTAGLLFWPLSSMRALTHLTWTSVAGFMTILFLLGVMIVRLADGYYTDNWTPGTETPCLTWNASLYTTIVANDSLWNNSHNSSSSTTTLPPAKPEPSRIHGNLPMASFSFDLVSALPDFSVAYSMHYNIPVLFGELRRRTPLRMIRAMGGTYATVLTFYIVFALIGIFTFGDGVKESTGDIMKCYSRDDLPMNIARVLMGVHFVCVYPIVGIACRSRFEAIVFEPGKVIPTWQRVTEAFALVVTTGIIAFFVSGIGIVFTLAGAFFGLSIVIIIPGLFYWRIYSDGFDLAGQRAILEAYEAEQEALARKNRSGAGDSAAVIGNGAAAASSSPRTSSAIEDHDEHHRQEHDVINNGTAVRSSISTASATHFVVSSSDIVLQSRHDDHALYGTIGPASRTAAAAVIGDQQDDDSDAVNVSESIPTETDLWLADMVRTPRRWLRVLSAVSIVFGIAASVLSIVNAFIKIAHSD